MAFTFHSFTIRIYTNMWTMEKYLQDWKIQQTWLCICWATCQTCSISIHLKLSSAFCWSRSRLIPSKECDSSVKPFGILNTRAASYMYVLCAGLLPTQHIQQFVHSMRYPSSQFICLVKWQFASLPRRRGTSIRRLDTIPSTLQSFHSIFFFFFTIRNKFVYLPLRFFFARSRLINYERIT